MKFDDFVYNKVVPIVMFINVFWNGPCALLAGDYTQAKLHFLWAVVFYFINLKHNNEKGD